MDIQIFEHKDTCYVSILEFGDAVLDKDYKTALDRYTELGYEIAFLKGKTSEDMEGILKRMLIIEMDIVEALGEYLKLEQIEVQPGDLRLINLSNVLVNKTTELIQKLLPIYSCMLDREIFAGLGLEMKVV